MILLFAYIYMEQGGVAITTVPAPSSSQSSMDHHHPSSAQTPSSAQSEVCDSLDLSILATTSSCLDSEKVGIGYLSGGTATASPARRLSVETESPAKIGHAPGTPLTPTANLKMLVAAASALDREKAAASQAKKDLVMDDLMDTGIQQTSGRKMKSLSLLCDRFLLVAEGDIGPGKEFSLEMIANSLGTNRRRIYDIINVMEALEMISKQSKNWYKWLGRENLLTTLAKLKSMASDDPDIRPYLEQERQRQRASDSDVDKENTGSNALSNSIDTGRTKQDHDGTPKQTEKESFQFPGVSQQQHHHHQHEEVDEQDFMFCDSDFPARSVRFDKSLGVLCQKFVMLFLITPDSEVTLEEAGRILVPDSFEDTLFASLNPPANPKTKVRRLYDIANILTSLGLIKKKTFVGPHHMKKPGYAWSGPALADIDTISVARKSDFTKGGMHGRRGVVRRPALNTPRPYTQGYDSPDQCGSAPATPTNSKEGHTFKRSLSFSSGSSSSKQPCVVARPLCPKQVDYLREMREFEAEIHKHSHRYPHVASVFHEFLQKYQGTLEQAATANGRFILPKSVSPPPNTSLSPPSFSSLSPSISPTSTASASQVLGPGNTLSGQTLLPPTMLQSDGSLGHSVLPETLGTTSTPHPQPFIDGNTPRQSYCPDNMLPSVPLSTSFNGQLPIAQIPSMPCVADPSSCAFPGKLSVPLTHPAPLSTVMSPTDTSFNACSSSITPPLAQGNPMVTNLANSILANVVLTSLQGKCGLDSPVTFTPPPPLPPSSNGTMSSTPSSSTMSQGTLISPPKTSTNAFVRVEDFLIPMSMSSKLSLQEALAATEMTSAALAAAQKPTGIGFLSANSTTTTFTEPPLTAPLPALAAGMPPNFGSLVSQRPIPSSQKPVPSITGSKQEAGVPGPSNLVAVSSVVTVDPTPFVSSHGLFPKEDTGYLANMPLRPAEVSVTMSNSNATRPSPPKRPRME